ncbi:SDR family oxidoreductase [Psychromonas sp. SA13A]|uniref:SDR family NAD(P)-dependent oxidoreductase n=1 Tax=Psychromonas sp. SA13A TaxID=2686346 RepID=UPI00140C5095|nr:SDR family oxidoreductase [Psychromonas sp. SA13A]
MVILITGAYGGIGRDICLSYLKVARELFITGRDPVKLNQLMDELNQFSDVPIHAIPADVNDDVTITNIFQQINNQCKRLDVLVHCAGILTQKSLMMTRLADIQLDISTNLISSIVFCQQASRLMSRNKQGVITLMSSVVANQGSAGQSVYGASKAGVEGLVKSLAKEFGPLGIRINAIAPGVINTELVSAFTEQDKSKLADKTCLKRLGEPEDITPIVQFLSSMGATYITGQVIAVDGGLAL